MPSINVLQRKFVELLVQSGMCRILNPYHGIEAAWMLCSDYQLRQIDLLYYGATREKQVISCGAAEGKTTLMHWLYTMERYVQVSVI